MGGLNTTKAVWKMLKSNIYALDGVDQHEFAKMSEVDSKHK